MKKSTLIFFTTLMLFFFFPPEVQAQYSSESACRANCPSPYTCGFDNGIQSYMCHRETPSSDSGCSNATFIYPYASCQYALSSFRSRGIPSGQGCISYSGGYYICKSTLTCPANCTSCSSSSVCTACSAGYYVSGGTCAKCPSNATCSGSSDFSCNSGYTKVNGGCVREAPANTVNSCPSRMALSSDGCCCINK